MPCGSEETGELELRERGDPTVNEEVELKSELGLWTLPCFSASRAGGGGIEGSCGYVGALSMDRQLLKMAVRF